MSKSQQSVEVNDSVAGSSSSGQPSRVKPKVDVGHPKAVPMKEYAIPGKTKIVLRLPDRTSEVSHGGDAKGVHSRASVVKNNGVFFK